jgi:ABC-type bacteriocin/lantibiotic exporter with double-glycine peptidase domain
MKRKYLIPEVIQTSAMDCGPAALKSLFAGFGLYLSYGRLREACQTDVDGTSLDTLEWLAGQLGLGMRQRLLPADLLLLNGAAALPAVVVVRLPDGGTHLVVLWRAHGRWLQIMDPAGGRLWVRRQEFLASLYEHQQAVDEADWRSWAMSEEFTTLLHERLARFKVDMPLWPDRALLDAALRLGETLMEAGELRCGEPAREFLAHCLAHREEIPERFFMASRDEGSPEQRLIKGAVLLSVTERKDAAAQIPPSLARVLSEPPPRIWQPIWQAVKPCGRGVLLALCLAIIAAAAGTVLEALVFRGLFDVSRHLPSPAERLMVMGATLALLAAVLLLDLGGSFGLMRLGRQIELALRVMFARKVPRLNDAYFQSRLLSDMAFRAHWLQLARQLPEIAGHCLHLGATMIFTAAAIMLFYPGSAAWVMLALLAACGTPWFFYPAAAERDLRCKELSASLGCFYLDSLRGSRAIQAHGAESALQRAQGLQLCDWATAAFRRQALHVRCNALQSALSLACIVAMLRHEIALGQSPAGLLLLVYWAMSIPALGQDMAETLRELPSVRSTLLRFLELMGSPEESFESRPAVADSRGVAVAMHEVEVAVAGRVVLSGVSLQIEPGEHVAVVGASGAGKSSLIGCLLGWYTPTHGRIEIDGELLGAESLAALRRQTAWIDPQVHLFNATLFSNMTYGNEPRASDAMGSVVETVELDPLLAKSARGLQTEIGEGGAFLSGGEGQRVRIARALLRTDVRLAVLDEPVRGLARAQRRTLLASLRADFAQATLLCVTHDVSDTHDFDRVLVIEGGRLVEDGSPAQLAMRQDSRYRQLLAAEQELHGGLWQHRDWRRLCMVDGMLKAGAMEEA